MTNKRNKRLAGTACTSGGVEPGRVAVRSGQPQTEIKLPDQTKTKLRVATVNVGTLNKRANEVAETFSRRRVDIGCLQETRYRGIGTKFVKGKNTRYKLYWSGNNDGSDGVAIMLAEKWVPQVMAVNRINSRIIALKLLIGKNIISVTSAYAPQQGLSSELKDAFYAHLNCHTAKIDANDIAITGADLNGHVGRSASGFEQVHGGFGYGTRNTEGNRILEFCTAQDMVVCNTCFQKQDSHLITYASGKDMTQIDYLLIKAKHRSLVKDTKVIPGEEVFKQHRLVVCDLSIKVCKTKKKPFSPKLRVWKLKEPAARENFSNVASSLLNPPNPTAGVEDTWSRLKTALTSATESSCGRTKSHSKPKITWWWNEEVESAILEKRRTWRLYKQGLCLESEYIAANKSAKRAVYFAKRAAETKEFGNLSTNKGSRDNAFKVAKLLKAQNQDIIGDPCIKDDKGCKAFSDPEKLMAWKEHYQRLLNEEFDWDESHLIMDSPVEGPAPWISKPVVIKALARMKDGKAAGSSGVVAEMLKASGESGFSTITQLFNSIIYESKIPEDWDRSIILNCFKGKGDAMERGNYRGLKLLEHSMKLFERILEQHIRSAVNIDDMQFGFMPGKGTMEAIFIIRQMQERFLAKKKTLYLTFIDLEKAFDRVPRKVVQWALRKVGVDEWIIRVVLAMYKLCKSAVSINNTIGEDFEVKVGVHQGSVLSPLLFIIVMEALSREFRTSLPWELLYADDLALLAESLQDLEHMYVAWKQGMEAKGLRVNINKTKVMVSQRGLKPHNKSGKFPCGVCQKGVGRNSIYCPSCNRWIHKRCSRIKGILSTAVNFKCSTCVSPPSAQQPTISLAGNNLEVVNQFCYLGDMLEASGGAESSSITRAKCGWKKFRDLLPLLGSKAVSLKLKGELYKTCVQNVLLYGTETWPARTEDTERLVTTEKTMIRWMCGAPKDNSISSSELRSKTGVTPIKELMRRSRLRWYGHVARKDKDNWLRRVQSLETAGKPGPGRPPKSWDEVVKEDLRATHLDPSLALNRDAWRTAIALKTV